MSSDPFLAPAVEWTPFYATRVIIASLVPLLLIIGVIKCAVIMRRPTTSKMCVSSLLLLFVAWILSSGSVAASLITGAPLDPTFMPVGVLSALLVPVSVGLAIIGLATYDRSRFVQGRAQAVWAISLGAVMTLFFVLELLFGVAESLRRGRPADVSAVGCMSPFIRHHGSNVFRDTEQILCTSELFRLQSPPCSPSPSSAAAAPATVPSCALDARRCWWTPA